MRVTLTPLTQVAVDYGAQPLLWDDGGLGAVFYLDCIYYYLFMRFLLFRTIQRPLEDRRGLRRAAAAVGRRWAFVDWGCVYHCLSMYLELFIYVFGTIY